MADHTDQESEDVDTATVEQVETQAGENEDEEVEGLEEAPATIEVSVEVLEGSRTASQQEEIETADREENIELKQEGVAGEETTPETKEFDDQGGEA